MLLKMEHVSSPIRSSACLTLMIAQARIVILRLARRTIEETESYLQRSSSSTQCLPTNEVLDDPIYIGFNETITAMFEASGDYLHQPFTQATETPIDYDAFINLDDF